MVSTSVKSERAVCCTHFVCPACVTPACRPVTPIQLMLHWKPIACRHSSSPLMCGCETMTRNMPSRWR